jgi:hypothetical protein
MLSAIDLYDQAGFETDKVNDVVIDGFLPPKPVTVLSVSQYAPE